MIPETKLKLSNNSLKDVIEWLKQGHFVCIHTKDIWKYYYFKPISDFVKNDQILIYIDLSKDPSLVSEDEWPWFILNAGFVRYTSSYVLPRDKNNIYHFFI
jgi:hypothetical protein